MSQPTPAAANAPEKPRTTWERVVTSTPIILTVVATVLAGLSSSELTRAQYYRSLAAQQQAKVSDQWNFFQAKRIRGSDMEGTIALLRAGSGAGKLSAEALRAAADRLPDEFDRAGRDAGALAKALEAARGGLEPAAADRLRQAAERARAAATAAAAAGRGKLGEALSAAASGKALAHLTAGTVPDRAERSPEQAKELDEALKAIDPDVRKSLDYFDPELLKGLNDLNPEIPRAVAQINARKREGAMGDTLGRISEPQIDKAIDDAEDRAAEYEEVGKPLARVYRGLDVLLAGQVGQARAIYRAAHDASAAAAALPSGDAKAEEVRRAAAALGRTADGLRADADEVGNDFKAAQLGFDARRYDREARYNQAVAGLYELNVRKASLESERHRNASKNFFYAMLAAQAGVTIATFSLAVRFRSALWALATIAGLAALGIGAYVYLKYLNL